MVASPHLQKLRSLTKELEEKDIALEATEKTLTSFFDMAYDLFAIFDNNGHLIKLNKSWERVLGYSLEELQSKPFLEFIHPNDIEATKKVFDVTLELEKEIIYFRNRWRCKNGLYKILCWTGTADIDNQLIFGIARDFVEMMDRVSE